MATGAFPGLQKKGWPGLGWLQLSQEPLTHPKQGPVPGGEAELLPVLSCSAFLLGAVTSTFPVPRASPAGPGGPLHGDVAEFFQAQLQLLGGKC